jgi:hypothetical protein
MDQTTQRERILRPFASFRPSWAAYRRVAQLNNKSNKLRVTLIQINDIGSVRKQGVTY